ncbi:hypothetical protein [Hungatella hathewayi]|uniref:hypothetical protein n=1 Tax=Hungatella hathewayi TaxID=154046 RepID=UPI0035617AB7
MKNDLKSEFIHLMTNEKVCDKKLILVDFNFSEVSVCFCIELVSGKIIEVIKPAYDYRDNSYFETNSKEIILRSYKSTMESVGDPISEEEYLLLESQIKPLTSMDFKKILCDNNLLSDFVQKVYSCKDKDLTEHINSILEL